MKAFLIVTTLVLFTSGIAEAKVRKASERGKRSKSPVTLQAPPCGQIEGDAWVKEPIRMSNYTGYAPGLGGINGSCRGGASRKHGFFPCRNTLHSYIAGKSKYIHTAAQQYGGSAFLFGCWASTLDLKAKGIPTGPAACHILAMADRYAKKESEGRRGTNGKIQGKKVDIEVGKTDGVFRKLAEKGDLGGIKCVGRLPGVTNGEVGSPRKIKRDPAAIGPVAMKR